MVQKYTIQDMELKPYKSWHKQRFSTGDLDFPTTLVRPRGNTKRRKDKSRSSGCGMHAISSWGGFSGDDFGAMTAMIFYDTNNLTSVAKILK